MVHVYYIQLPPIVNLWSAFGSNSEFGRSREADRRGEAWSRQPEQQIMLLQVVKAESMRVGAGGEGAGPLWVMGE